MDPDQIKASYEENLREVISTAEAMLNEPLQRDKTKKPKQMLAKLNSKVCATGTLLTGFNKAIRNEV